VKVGVASQGATAGCFSNKAGWRAPAAQRPSNVQSADKSGRERWLPSKLFTIAVMTVPRALGIKDANAPTTKMCCLKGSPPSCSLHSERQSGNRNFATRIGSAAPHAGSSRWSGLPLK
jgi:hypothetical protein